MVPEVPPLTVWATKPRGKLVALLADRGIVVAPALDESASADRYLLSPRVAVERWTGCGLLATLQASPCRPEDERISVRVVDRSAVVGVLRQLRDRRLRGEG